MTVKPKSNPCIDNTCAMACDKDVSLIYLEFTHPNNVILSYENIITQTSFFPGGKLTGKLIALIKI